MNIKVIDKISTGENNYEKKVKLKEILDNQLDKYYPCDLIEIDSLRKLQQKIKVARITIIEWVKEYLHGRYGSTTYLNKYNEIWTSRGFHSRRQVDDSKFKLFIEIMDRQMKNYPNNIETIEGVRQLSKRIGVSRITLTTWIKNYLIHKKGPVISKIVYNNIWSNRTGQFPYGYKVTHDRIKEYVINRNGNLITSETDYLKMRGRPNVKFIEIICSKNHYFSARLDRLLYEGTWCPICSEYKTQRVMRIYMEQIFGVTFRETSFHKAYNLTAKNNRRLRWDGYNGSVKVNNRMFRIAFEYDGIQHDIFPNPYHKNKEEFLKQIKNDRKKDNIALESDKRTTVIRLKAIQGYDFTTTHMFEKEIINQFFQATGILLEFKGYLFDIGTFTLKEKPKNLERFLENGGPGAI